MYRQLLSPLHSLGAKPGKKGRPHNLPLPAGLQPQCSGASTRKCQVLLLLHDGFFRFGSR